MAEYLGSFRPFAAPPNEAETPRPEQIEGIAVITYKDNSVKNFTVLLLALSRRQRKPDGKVVPGQLIWGTLTELKPQIPHLKK